MLEIPELQTEDLLIEEMAELTRALIKMKRYSCEDTKLKWTYQEINENIKEEYIQVLLLLEELKFSVFNDNKEFRKYMINEINRQESDN